MPHQGQTGIVVESQGYRLLGTLFLAPDDSPTPTAVILHGMPGIEQNVDLAHALRSNGWNSVIFHPRGSWGSEGAYWLKSHPRDARAVLDALSSGTYPQVDPARLVLIGHSMGGWAAILTAAQDERVRGVAVYGGVCIPGELPWGRDIGEEEFTPWLTGITPEMFEDQWKLIGVDNYNPVKQVAKIVPRPVLIIHGEPDDVVPVSQAQALHDRAGEPKKIILHPDANHSFTWHRTWLIEQLLPWLTQFV